MKMPFIASLLLSLVACSDEKEASYATYGEAERAGAIRRGWLPPFVPKAMAESGRVEEVDRDVEAILLCTHSYSGAVVANYRTGLVTYLTPVEWAREHCPGPE